MARTRDRYRPVNTRAPAPRKITDREREQLIEKAEKTEKTTRKVQKARE